MPSNTSPPRLRGRPAKRATTPSSPSISLPTRTTASSPSPGQRLRIPPIFVRDALRPTNNNQNERKNMNNQFDELTKSLAQSVTRRAALKKFGVGLAGMALACFGLAIRAHAAGPTFATIDYPGAAATLAVDINANGQIVGRFVD